MSSPLSVAALVVAAVIGFAAPRPAAAQAPAKNDPAAANVDLQQAFAAAQASAKGSDTLDAAYELLGIAGTAQSRNNKALATSASTAFDDLVQRATAAAQRKGGALARDTLDQLVDLRFFARSQEIQPAMAALDTAMRTLFGPVSQSVAQQVDSGHEWEEKIDALNDLGSLQASAAQVLMQDTANDIGKAFDAKAGALEKLADQAGEESERGRRLASVVDAKRSRDEQVADATANNVDSVAAQLKAGPKTEESARAEGNEDVPADMIGETSCIETATRAKPSDPKAQRAHDRACVNSGRVPATTRCPVANLSMACYAKVPDGEKVTYVYRNTPEETYFRKKCAADDTVPASRIPPTGVPFRSRELTLAFVCAPAGSDNASD